MSKSGQQQQPHQQMQQQQQQQGKMMVVHHQRTTTPDGSQVYLLQPSQSHPQQRQVIGWKIRKN